MNFETEQADTINIFDILIKCKKVNLVRTSPQ